MDSRNRPLIFLLTLFVVVTLLSSPVKADESSSEKVGDVLQILIPAAAFGIAHFSRDNEGEVQFYKSFFSNLAITYGLQFAVQKQRPDGSGDDSFPSAHVSMSTQGAAFVQKRYGWQYSIPAYAGVVYVGYSRLNSNKHDVGDVLAGGAIGLLSSYVFTTSYKGLTILPSINKDSYSLNVLTEW